MDLKIEKVDDLTFTIFTGKNGDPNQPVPWADFDAYLAGQWGLMASPTWLDAVDGRPVAGRPAGRHRARSSSRATPRATASSSPATRTTG